jgi:hypothetical protein
VPTVLRYFHPFGYPTYILNNSLAAGKSIPKWHKRACLGVYLGRSPNHSQSVSLVMNVATGLVSLDSTSNLMISSRPSRAMIHTQTIGNPRQPILGRNPGLGLGRHQSKRTHLCQQHKSVRVIMPATAMPISSKLQRQPKKVLMPIHQMEETNSALRERPTSPGSNHRINLRRTQR